MKTLREYIDQLDEISRRDFLKGAGAAAVGAAGGISADRFLKTQQNRRIVLPNDPTAYYLLGYQWGFSYLSPYNQTLEKWLEKTGPYIGEVTLRLKSSGPDNLTGAYQKGFDEARADVKSYKDQGMTDQKIAERYASTWESTFRNLMGKLNQTNEEIDEDASPDAIKRIKELAK